jgi:recombination protein RecA
MARQKRKTTKQDIQNIIGDSYISDLTKNINREFGNIAYILGEGDSPTEIVGYISTGSTLLDTIISNRKEGGAPIGRITEIAGTESSGKSLMAIHMIKDTIKKGGVPIYFDTENASSVDFMKRVGVDVNKLTYIQPKTIEEVFSIAESTIKHVRENSPDTIITIIWDSVAATPTKEELQQDYDHKEMAPAARVIARGLKKITQYLGDTKVCFVALNQLKKKIQTFGFSADTWTTPGGLGFNYHASVRVRLSKGNKIRNKNATKDEPPIGVGTIAEVVKNKLSSPFRKCKFNVYFQYGIDDISSWVEPLMNADIIYSSSKNGEEAKNGRYYAIRQDGTDEVLIVEKDEWRKYIISDPDMQENLRQKVIDTLITDYSETDDIDVSNIEIIDDDEDSI